MKIKHLVFLFLLISCSNDPVISDIPVIKIADALNNPESILLDEICDTIFIIPLETTDEILIDHISDVSYYGDEIYVVHDNICSVFSPDGKYIRRIGNRGEGPEEYLSIYSEPVFCANSVFIYCRLSKRLLRYTLEGEYINTIRIENGLSSLVALPDGTIAGYVDNASGDKENRLVFFTTEGIFTDSVKTFKKYENVLPLRLMRESSLYYYNDSLRLKEASNDTLFTIDKDFSLHPVCIVDVSPRLSGDDFRYQIKSIRDDIHKKMMFFTVLYENDRYIIFDGRGRTWARHVFLWDKEKEEVRYGHLLYSEKYYSLFDKELTTVTTPSGTSVTTEDGTPVFGIKSVLPDNKIIVGVEKSATGDWDDNPVLVFVVM